MTSTGTPRDGAAGLAPAFSAVLAVRLCVAEHAPSLPDALFALGAAALGLLALARGKRVPQGLAAITLAAVGALTASAVAAPQALLSTYALPAALGPLATLLVVVALGPAARATSLVALAASGALSSMVAAAQRFYLWPRALAEVDALGVSRAMAERLASGRPLGLSLSPDLGGALALAGLAASLALSAERRGLARWLALCAALVCLSGAALSRSAGVALALGAFVFATVALAALGRRRRLGPRVWLLVGTLMVFVPAVSFSLLGRGFEALSRSAGERLVNWQIALDAALEHPLLGVGFGRFAAAYAAHRTPDANVTRYAHSLPFEAFAETGLLGVTALGALASLVVLVAGRAWFIVPATRSLSAAMVAAGAAALALRTGFDYDAQVAQTATALAALCGLVLVDASSDQVRQSPGRPVAATALALMFLGAGGLALPLALREAALAPFEYGGQGGEDDARRLIAYVERFPGDDHARVAALPLVLTALARCEEGCAEAAAALERSFEARLAAPYPPPPLALTAARLALARGADAAARAHIAAGLRASPGDRALHVASVSLAPNGKARAAAYAEALRWLPRAELDAALSTADP